MCSFVVFVYFDFPIKCKCSWQVWLRIVPKNEKIRCNRKSIWFRCDSDAWRRCHCSYFYTLYFIASTIRIQTFTIFVGGLISWKEDQRTSGKHCDLLISHSTDSFASVPHMSCQVVPIYDSTEVGRGLRWHGAVTKRCCKFDEKTRR